MEGYENGSPLFKMAFCTNTMVHGTSEYAKRISKQDGSIKLNRKSKHLGAKDFRTFRCRAKGAYLLGQRGESSSIVRPT